MCRRPDVAGGVASNKEAMLATPFFIGNSRCIRRGFLPCPRRGLDIRDIMECTMRIMDYK